MPVCSSCKRFIPAHCPIRGKRSQLDDACEEFDPIKEIPKICGTCIYFYIEENGKEVCYHVVPMSAEQTKEITKNTNAEDCDCYRLSGVLPDGV